MIRAFLAFDISEEVRKGLKAFVENLQSQTKGVKWVEAKNYHVTLKFFGNIDEEKVLPSIRKIIEENAASVKAVPLVCEEIGLFPTWRSPRIIWVDLKGNTQGLIDLQKRLEAAFEKLGFPKENRAFKMHLTLARIKSLVKPTDWIETLKAIPQKKFGSVLIDHLTLYKSVLTKQGPIYTSLMKFKI